MNVFSRDLYPTLILAAPFVQREGFCFWSTLKNGYDLWTGFDLWHGYKSGNLDTADNLRIQLTSSRQLFYAGAIVFLIGAIGMLATKRQNQPTTGLAKNKTITQVPNSHVKSYKKYVFPVVAALGCLATAYAYINIYRDSAALREILNMRYSYLLC